MFKIQSPTIVKLEGNEYFIAEIDGTVATLRPCEPRYGLQGDVHINMEYEYDLIELVSEGRTLTPADVDIELE